MNVEKRNLPASIHQRLFNKARQSGRALINYFNIMQLNGSYIGFPSPNIQNYAP